MEWLTTILTSGNLPTIIAAAIVITLLCILLVKTRILNIHTKHVTIGAEDVNSYYERTIVRNQIQHAHDFCMSLESKIIQVTPNLLYGGYFTKFILERVFDKVIEWITFNHIEATEAYISCKQKEIRYLVYSLGPREEFKTPEFQARMDKWTSELIYQLIEIRKLYTEQKVS
jgi:hypothetical protein